MEQRTEEWFDARLGKVTASKIKDVVAKTKTGYAATRKNYMAQLICERLTGQRQESYVNAAMQWGTDQEPNAREEYELSHSGMVEEVGFIDHPTIDMAGASPDGLIGSAGMIEIKCPNTATHIEWLLAGKVPPEHVPQLAWQMACTGRYWVDFVTYDPRLPKKHQMMVVRYKRDDGYIKELEAEVIKFIAEINETIRKLEEL